MSNFNILNRQKNFASDIDKKFFVSLKVSREDDPKEGMKRKVRNVIERMLRFYMRGIGKVQEGRDPSLNQPAAPGDYQFNYIPDGLREDEVASRYRLLKQG